MTVLFSKSSVVFLMRKTTDDFWGVTKKYELCISFKERFYVALNWEQRSWCIIVIVIVATVIHLILK